MRQMTSRITSTTMINAVNSTTRRTAATNPWRNIDSQVPPAAGRPTPPGTGVLVGVGVEVGVSVGVGEGVIVGVSVGVGEGVIVGVSVGVGDGVTVGVSVGVAVGVRVGGTGVGTTRRVLVGSGYCVTALVG